MHKKQEESKNECQKLKGGRRENRREKLLMAFIVYGEDV
jgi:hypothetical protein